MKTNVRQTSMDAYFTMWGKGVILNQKGKICRELVVVDKALTRVELSERSGIRINAVSGRVNELINDGYLVETTLRKCDYTGSLVHPVKLTGKYNGY